MTFKSDLNFSLIEIVGVGCHSLYCDIVLIDHVAPPRRRREGRKWNEFGVERRWMPSLPLRARKRNRKGSILATLAAFVAAAVKVETEALVALDID